MPNLTTLLAILQQSEYDFEYFQRWLNEHGADKTQIEPKTWTIKLKLIKTFTNIFKILPGISLVTRIKLATSLTQPAEWLIRQNFYLRASWKLWLAKKSGLTVIAFAGSYGKTSTKKIAEHLLSQFFPTLATAKSINTPLGIAQFILKELRPSHRYLLVEMGEYYPGDISQLANFIKPKYGIVCPVGRQHLERMGSLNSIAATVLELANFLKDNQAVLIHDSLQSFSQSANLGSWYGQSDLADWRLIKTSLSRSGTEGEIMTPKQKFQVFSPLFGSHQLVNSLPGLWLCQKLGLDLPKAIKALGATPYVPHRHEPTFATNNVLILDNGYNSNPDSAIHSLELLKALPASRRIVVTPGFVELGQASTQLHEIFGQQLAKNCDYLAILESPASAAIEHGWLKAGGSRDRIILAETQEAAISALKEKIIPDSIILFENNLPEVYK